MSRHVRPAPATTYITSIVMNVAIIGLILVIKATSKKLQWVEGEDETPVALH